MSAFADSALARALQRAWWRRDAPGWVALLLPLAALYRLLWAGREWAYRLGLKRSRAAPVPVVVVGNLVVGGAGKTPCTIALVQGLRTLGWTPGVISRGYGAAASAPHQVLAKSAAAEVGDEPLLIHLRSAAPVVVGADRVAAAALLCRLHPTVDVIVADDGLQHRALRRAAQLIVFDGRGLGNGHLLPAGPLREPFTPMPPPASVVVYNAQQPSTPWPGDCAQRRLAGAVPLRDWWAGAAASPALLSSLEGARLIAAAGIAEPERFFTMLEAAGLHFERLPLPDHATFEPRPWPNAATMVLVTEKDAAKLEPDAADAARILVVPLDFELPSSTLAAVAALLPPVRPRSTP